MKGFFQQIVLRNVIMNPIKSPSDNFRTIVAEGSWFLISFIKTFQPQSNSEPLITTQPSSGYFQQNPICLNEEDKNYATKEVNLKDPLGKCSRCYWYPTQSPYRDGRNSLKKGQKPNIKNVLQFKRATSGSAAGEWGLDPSCLCFPKEGHVAWKGSHWTQGSCSGTAALCTPGQPWGGGLRGKSSHCSPDFLPNQFPHVLGST